MDLMSDDLETNEREVRSPPLLANQMMTPEERKAAR